MMGSTNVLRRFGLVWTSITLIAIILLLKSNGVDAWGVPQQQKTRNRRDVKHVVPLEDRRSSLLRSIAATTALWTTTTTLPPFASAAPPVSIMMEELGYFPVSNKNNQVVYVPARLKRDSSDQAIALADYMRQHNIVLAGAFWCPHCRRQRELFGRQANVPYIECAAQGYQSQATTWCTKVQAPGITGYPTWVQGMKVIAEGEMALDVLATKLGYPGTIDPALEWNLPPALGAASCAQQ